MKRPSPLKVWRTIANASTAAAIIASAVSLYCAGWIVYTKQKTTEHEQRVYQHSSIYTSEPLKLEARPIAQVRPVNWSAVAPRAQSAVVMIEIGDRYRYDRELIEGYRGNPVLEAAQQLYLRLTDGFIESDYEWRKAGAGVIVRSDGLVMTAAHVVNKHRRYRVTTTSGIQAVARLVAIDSQQDIAVLKFDAHTVPAAPLAATAKLPVGAPIIAIGTPAGEPFTVTAGIITTTRQRFPWTAYDDLVGVDARIVGGNSGGGIFNQEGELVGILSLGGMNQALGYAVPIDRAREVLKHVASADKLGSMTGEPTPATPNRNPCGVATNYGTQVRLAGILQQPSLAPRGQCQRKAA